MEGFMDLAVIGKFIKERRKAKNLTQAQLAQKLFVSEKTISKWECGNGFPDTTLMLPLCKVLGISANELLSGKLLEESEYKDRAEQNLVTLQSINQRNVKLLLTVELVLGLLSVIVLLIPIIIAGYVDIPTLEKVLIIVAGALLCFVGFYFCMIVEKDAGLYECKHCHHKYVPTFKSILWSMHMGRTRHMKCPNCGKKSWQHKVIE